MTSNPTQAEAKLYAAQIIPALHDIQHEHGYLKREAVEGFARNEGIPLHRIQAVIGFFSLFRTTPPPAVTLRVCRDMACAMACATPEAAGNAANNSTLNPRDTLKDLQSAAAEIKGKGSIVVEGVSCLGRCDRAPAACAVVNRSTHAGDNKSSVEEFFYLGRTRESLKRVLNELAEGRTPPPDTDASHTNGRSQWMIDPYLNSEIKYQGVIKAVEKRRESLRLAIDVAAKERAWGTLRVETLNAAIDSGRFEFDDEQMARDFRGLVLNDSWSDAILEEMGGKPDSKDKQADLRGMGGGGASSAQKWRDVRDAIRTAHRRGADDRGFIVVNGDESEPGTFKDRELLLRTPHLIVEGVILAGLVTGATQGFIYIRHEYPEQIEACRAEIARAEALGLCGIDALALGGSFPVEVFVSPGGYICGEQSALIEAMSDHRAEPRSMPPKLETNGLMQLPTVVSNVETFAWAPFVWLREGKTYAGMGLNTWRGRRFFSVCGDVKRPGVYEVPMGMKLGELIFGEAYCQGMVGPWKFKAFAPSGPSGGFLPAVLPKTGLPRNHNVDPQWTALAARQGFDPAASELDILNMELELDLFRALSPTAMLGAGLVVYDERRNMAEEAVNALEFYKAESCGKCVPCRIGSQKLAVLGDNLLNKRISADQWDKLQPELKELLPVINSASICGLGRSVPVPLETLLKFFPDDIKQFTPSQPAATIAPEARS